MGTIRLNRNAADSCTIISNQFIDRIMPEARGEYVKVYLYLLRCIQGGRDDVSVSSMADLFNYNESDVLRALKYWVRQGIMTLDTNPAGEITGITMHSAASERQEAEPASAPAVSAPAEISSASAAASSAAPVVSASLPESPAMPAKKKYSAADIQAFSQNPDIEELFFIIQTYLKHPLSSTDTNTILYWYDCLHFSTELIEYLVEYCISKGHSSTRYMDKVALGWAENGISTVEEAKESASAHSQVYYTVMKALGIHGRNLVPSETDYIAKWTKEYGFGTEMIREACSRTISATHQPSFEYTDSILTRWYQNQVRTADDVKKLDEQHNQNRKAQQNTADAKNGRTNKFNNFNQRSYDADQLEAILLNSVE